MILIITREEKFDTKDVNMNRNRGFMNIQQNINFLQLSKLRFIYLQRKRKMIKKRKKVKHKKSIFSIYVFSYIENSTLKRDKT